MVFICKYSASRECDGCMACYDDDIPVCPECGKEADVFHIGSFGEILGCNCCVQIMDSWQLDKEERFGVPESDARYTLRMRKAEETRKMVNAKNAGSAGNAEETGKTGKNDGIHVSSGTPSGITKNLSPSLSQ